MTCKCEARTHAPRLVVVTGGPGAGKTAFLELVRRNFCDHVQVLPEAASIVFGGGFPRRSTLAGRRAAQRAIFRVQRELERMAIEERQAAVVLCDRGTLDGLAYWPEDDSTFWSDLDAGAEEERARYAVVIHLRTPAVDKGYNHLNPLRIESALEAAAIDKRIAEVWAPHPRRFTVESTTDFLDKVEQALELVRHEVPHCCGTGQITTSSSDRCSSRA